ncbi:Astacin-like metalloprotease toxin 1 [Argiope bruennichi]|uniref:Metalloendopeptidase n=1 Tax=Argiope bruennichi TaxID=94029 RepID=A0A8T0FTV6_ARGBR|nr:Astacin-like metalloprotease toxin 1 [Argiope bruennichi]
MIRKTLSFARWGDSECLFKNTSFCKRYTQLSRFEMLWKLLLSLAAFFTKPFHGPLDQDPFNITAADQEPYEISPYGPQSWREAHIAMQALQGENGDMRFAADWPESAGIRDEKYRWPGYPGKATVPYVMDGSLKSIEHLIVKAMDQYHKNTCIKFVKRTNERNYIRMVKKGGCYSYVGRVGGAQELSLGRGCEYVGTIVHELGHAIGLFHEHQRSDRDQYLNVYSNNVISGQMHNFNKTPASQELKWAKYDYTSIMHYGNYAFSKQPGKLKTMEAKNGTPLKEPYEKAGLNSVDIDLVKKLYKC